MDEKELEIARRALEGPEHTAKREEAEKAKLVATERATIETKLAEIRKQKEVLELAWIDLDNQRKSIRTILLPLLDEEKKIEEEEAKIEQEEASTGVPEAKHGVEERRWAIQEQRKALEGKKWEQEQKIVAIEQTIEANTKKYRLLLDDEDKAQVRLDQLTSQTNHAAN